MKLAGAELCQTQVKLGQLARLGKLAKLKFRENEIDDNYLVCEVGFSRQMGRRADVMRMQTQEQGPPSGSAEIKLLCH